MKKMNKRGFFLVETIVVVTIAATVLVILYTQINSFFSNYNRTSKYNTVDAVHAVHNIKLTIVENYTPNLITDLDTSGPIFDITSYDFDADNYYDTLIDKLNIDKVYFTPYDINDVIDNYETYDINASLLDFLKTQRVNDTKEDTYRIIIMLNNGHYGSVYLTPEDLI